MYADDIKSRFLRGESIHDLALFYGMTDLEIENLIRFSVEHGNTKNRLGLSPKGDY